MQEAIIREIIQAIPEIATTVSSQSALHHILSETVHDYFSAPDATIPHVSFLTGLKLEKKQFGHVGSYDLLNINEFIIFAIYERGKTRYKKFLDLGGNVGLHALICHHLGYEVVSLEPDPINRESFDRNIALNGASSIKVLDYAISDRCEKVQFVHVEGNYTASHISGSRNYHGDAKFFDVETVTFEKLGFMPDLIKMDIEGHEARVIQSIDKCYWEHMDAIIEIHDIPNRDAIFNYFSSIGINMFSQKTKFEKVTSAEQLPSHHTHGMVFVSKEETMSLWH